MPYPAGREVVGGLADGRTAIAGNVVIEVARRGGHVTCTVDGLEPARTAFEGLPPGSLFR